VCIKSIRKYEFIKRSALHFTQYSIICKSYKIPLICKRLYTAKMLIKQSSIVLGSYTVAIYTLEPACQVTLLSCFESVDGVLTFSFRFCMTQGFYSSWKVLDVFSWKFPDLESPGKSLWSLKVLEKILLKYTHFFHRLKWETSNSLLPSLCWLLLT